MEKKSFLSFPFLAYFHSLSNLEQQVVVFEAEILTGEACGGIKSIKLQDHLTKNIKQKRVVQGKQTGKEAIGQKTSGKLRLEIQSHRKGGKGEPRFFCFFFFLLFYKAFAVMSIEGKGKVEVKS